MVELTECSRCGCGMESGGHCGCESDSENWDKANWLGGKLLQKKIFKNLREDK